ncbi:hypothetical protein PGTUg99_012365 [Puccinia graminis f. sp. tritici]|uniref:Uncharacterized protein n=1 Tax=Puccinia graminis f. sp. tritici TaxID=56615 RepID=A0A5B0QZM5_PUCGR|nr:hypothetical protein PGTUg99_012365 [Puccinia graminis f. sp. tritici]
MSDDSNCDFKLAPKPAGTISGAAATISRLTPKTQAIRQALASKKNTDASEALQHKLGRTILEGSKNNCLPLGASSKGKAPAALDNAPVETHFHSRITDKPTGSSLANWCCADPPHQHTKPLQTELLIAELQAKRKDNRLCQEELSKLLDPAHPAQSAQLSSQTQLSQLLDPAQSALKPSSLIQLVQLWDPAHSALKSSSSSSKISSKTSSKTSSNP